MTREMSIHAGPPRLLMTGDLHLGRSSSRVPAQIPRDELRATTAWNRIVDLALAEDVSVVCLSGDIADQDNRFWEAIGPLEQGLGRLAGAGIPCVAVAGNHDYQVLMQLADQLPPENFCLLGRGGRWERLVLKQGAAAALVVDGWSFPAKHVHESPLTSYDLPRDDLTVPHLGMVHGDLYAASSPYAPLDLAAMQRARVDGWLIGHLHAPRMHADEGKPWVFYPGSPQAFDPGETGAHGPWIAVAENNVLGVPEQRPLSSVWYAQLDVDLDGVKTPSECSQRILDAVRAAAKDIVGQAGPHSTYISLRLRLTGSTPIAHEIETHTAELAKDFHHKVQDVTVGVDRVSVETLPAIDLAEHARMASPPGAVARLLQELEGGEISEQVSDLIRSTRRQLEQRARASHYAALDAVDITDEDARQHLRVQGRAFLSRLLQP
jgi:exonuclease SbcD